MHPLVGLGLGGAAFTPRDVPHDGARVGEPVWGPAGLLRDLELRLGLAPLAAPESVRVQRYKARIEAVGDPGAFYAASFAVDAIGTAATLLAWRDALIEAGWDGGRIADGGDRLAAIAAIECAVGDAANSSEALPLGQADRLVRVERELSGFRGRVYDEVSLAEPSVLWPRLWQRIFERLEGLGARFSKLTSSWRGAAKSTDLGRLQMLLRSKTAARSDAGERGQRGARGERDEAAAGAAATVEGDGSLRVVRGDTPAELAELTAALLASCAASESLVVRAHDPAPLEAALVRHALAAQGHRSESACRPAMQILPLAVELAFEPRDPYRVLELLTLPIGPFRGVVGQRLARAVARQPGVGGQEWRRAKTDAKEMLRAWKLRALVEAGAPEAKAETEAEAYAAERMQRVAVWLEQPGAPAHGIARADLLAVGERVQAWLQKRMGTPEAELYGPAHAQAKAFAQALREESRSTFPQEEARQLLDHLARGAHAHAISTEEAGRIPHVAHPAALLAERGTIVVWGFVAGTERRPALPPWNHVETGALAAAGVTFPAASELLRAEAEAWRRTVLAATERVVFVVPGTVKGEPKAPHPLWDEIAARLRLDEASAARLTVHARDALEGRASLVPASTLPPLALPEPRGTWSVPPELLVPADPAKGTSVTSLETLATCPLRWVLDQRASLRSGAIAKVASGPLLAGNLTHRLVEELHEERAFDKDEDALVAAAEARFTTLLEEEGATLLLPGASVERVQLVAQVKNAMRALHRYLATSGFTIAAVEERLATESALGTLTGRLDVRLVDEQGKAAVLDLKWGAATYRDLLTSGRAVQLAVYARALAGTSPRTSWVPAAYFALGAGKVLATDSRMKADRLLEGPPIAETWARIETTAKAALESTSRGTIHVSATRRGLPLLDALGVEESARKDHFEAERDAACKYCSHDAICGRRWEVLA
jgi:ATP-dependent helicase/nuclease subunit B